LWNFYNVTKSVTWKKASKSQKMANCVKDEAVNSGYIKKSREIKRSKDGSIQREFTT